MDKNLNTLVERLERLFPETTIEYHGETFGNENSNIPCSFEENFAPPRTLDWYEVIERLKTNGLEIRNIKDK